MSEELERKALDVLAQRWREGWTGDAGFGGCCTPDLSYEDPVSVEPLRGPDELDGHARALRTAFPDLRLEPTAAPLSAEGNACFAWRLAGTNTGDLGALVPATGRFVTLHGLHYVELSDGLVRRARGFFDLYDAAVQLGLLPARGGLGEAAVLLVRGFGLRRRIP